MKSDSARGKQQSGMCSQHFLHRQPAGIFVAMQQDGNEQGRRVAARQVNQSGPGQDFMQTIGTKFEQAGGKLLVYLQHHTLHSCTGAPERWFSWNSSSRLSATYPRPNVTRLIDGSANPS